MMTWNKINFQFPSNSLMEMVAMMHDYTMMFMTSIMTVVLLSLVFNLFTAVFSLEFLAHHELESVWTFLPFFLLMFIVIPSITVLYSLDTCLFCGMCLSVTGHQWYWTYNFGSFMSESFNSYMLPLESSALRLLDVDNRIKIPCGIPVRFMATSADVIHSWTIPSFGVKMDAVPGRINQICMSSGRSGVFFGQCSEICGANHSFMPIVMEVHPFNKE